MNDPIRVLLVDDHALVRESVRRFLEAEPEIEVLGTSADGSSAIEFASDHEIDVVLMDIDMPGLDCFDAAERIRSQQPRVEVVFLSAFFHDHYIDRALAVRAAGYLTKSEPPAKVIDAIRQVGRGRVYFSPEVSERIVEDASGVRLASNSRTRGSTLSPREIEVVRYISRGLSKKDIAGIMSLSVKTIEGHTHNIMRKLDLHNRVELTRFAIREGLAEA
ncbi:MAG: response regulator transcription factor [Planctomycetota bacterium]